MPALVAGIHVFLTEAQQAEAWMAGTSPAMTPERWFHVTGIRSKFAKSVWGAPCGIYANMLSDAMALRLADDVVT